MIDTESLKNLVIDMATTGLLTSYVEGDDTVNEILANLPPVSNKRKKLLEQSFDYDEKPSIPKHWKWVRLGEFSSYGDTPTKILVDSMKEQMWILELEDIETGGKLLVKKRFPDRKPAGEKTAFTKGQILYSKLRPYLKKVLVADEDGASTPELVSFDVFGGVNSQYISYCLINSYVDRMINKRSYGVKMPRVDAGFMVNIPIPLPPLLEQELIVKLVETAFHEIDRIADLQQRYESDREILKGKIIDAGICGKLTEQLPEDGDAEELYAQIQEEKAKLIKDGKIKKENPLPPISEDEIPFEIPSNWKWCRLQELVYILGDGIHGTPHYDQCGEYYFINGNNLSEGKIVLKASTKRIGEDEYLKYKKDLNESTILVSINGTIGNLAYYNNERIILGKSACYFTLLDRRMKEFVFFVLKSDYFLKYAHFSATGVTIKNVSLKAMNYFMIPMPSIIEQERIVNRINRLMGILIGNVA